MSYEKEKISDGFQFDSDKPKQSLFKSNDVYSAIQLTGSSFINNEIYLNYINDDGRIPLGMFFFEEQNTSDNPFEITSEDEIFEKLPKILITKNIYSMVLDLMKRTSEKGVIRLVKVAAGVRQ